jgi:hypothetical protein
VSTASRKRRRPPDNNAGLVARLCDEASALTRQLAVPASDTKMRHLLDRIDEATAGLAGMPSSSPSDIQAKLTVLCVRLRDNLHPELRAEILTYLLAESVREDCRMYLAVALRGLPRR